MADIPFDREFWTDVLRRVARRTRGHGDAEDLLHSAFVRYQCYRSRRNVENPAAFLVQTATNIRVDNYRHDRLSDDFAADLARETQNHAPLQDEVIAARARLARVKAGLDHLSPRTRDIFLMHRLHDLKYREIAERMGITESAVEKHVAKATVFLTRWAAGW